MGCAACGTDNVVTRRSGPHLCEYCGQCGRWLRGLPQHRSIEEFVWPVGAKHKGRTLGDIFLHDLPYLKWAANNMQGNLQRKAKEILEQKGVLTPPPPAEPQTPAPSDSEDLPWD